MSVLSHLEPQNVFSYFETICGIPHGSGNTGAIVDYCVRFAEERGFSWYRDKADNLVIRKPASPGYEQAETVILQGHTDMVCEKDPGLDFDFTKDGIRLVVEGDTLRADGTTLGGDNGIAVAMCLAILDDKTLHHPPLEVLLTADEEIGMLGAFRWLRIPSSVCIKNSLTRRLPWRRFTPALSAASSRTASPIWTACPSARRWPTYIRPESI